jgi:precorrin-6A/cobalt-precorrin-6A reductase
VRVLILGGTAEARHLAGELTLHGDEVLTSLAGVTSSAEPVAGATRVGGFGGAEGLAEFVATWRPDVVVDATHPFAAAITSNAVSACVDVPLIVLRRPEWVAEPGDRWTSCASVADCALAVRALPAGVVFLAVGRRDVAAFAADDVHAFVARSIEPPPGPVPQRLTVLLGRGPYALPGELALMRSHAVDVLVCKNSGGEATAAKLAAARELGLPVLMAERPPLPVGVDAVTDVDAVLARLGR